MKKAYLGLAVAGLVFPYAFFIPFLLQNGLDLPLLWQQLTANNISLFFAADVVLGSVALWVWMYFDMQRRPVKLWGLSVLGNLLVGLSFALPLYLFLREDG